MARKILVTILAALILITSAFAINDSSVSVAASEPQTISTDPTPLTAATRSELEQKILATTVRIEMQGWNKIGPTLQPITNGGKSHATIIAGRYLVTHNHFSADLTTLASPEEEGYTGITLRKADGSLLLDNAPLNSFTIVHEEQETLVLEFVDENGVGLFDALGQPSAKTIAWDAVPWQVDTELAHIDWDKDTAHVDWVTVDAVSLDGQVPHLQVSNFAQDGASGGGAFWNGYHVGNNWARNVEKDPQTNEVTRLYTLIALNSLEVTSFQ